MSQQGFIKMINRRVLIKSFCSLLILITIVSIGNLVVVQAQGDADGDGIPDASDDCPYDSGVGRYFGGVDGENGCPVDTDGDRIVDGLDQCPFEWYPPDFLAPNGCSIGPTPTPTPSPTPTLVPILGNGKCLLASGDWQNLILRAEPSLEGEYLYLLNASIGYEVSGIFEDETSYWYQVGDGWVLGSLVRLIGDNCPLPQFIIQEQEQLALDPSRATAAGYDLLSLIGICSYSQERATTTPLFVQLNQLSRVASCQEIPSTGFQAFISPIPQTVGTPELVEILRLFETVGTTNPNLIEQDIASTSSLKGNVNAIANLTQIIQLSPTLPLKYADIADLLDAAYRQQSLDDSFVLSDLTLAQLQPFLPATHPYRSTQSGVLITTEVISRLNAVQKDLLVNAILDSYYFNSFLPIPSTELAQAVQNALPPNHPLKFASLDQWVALLTELLPCKGSEEEIGITCSSLARASNLDIQETINAIVTIFYQQPTIEVNSPEFLASVQSQLGITHPAKTITPENMLLFIQELLQCDGLTPIVDCSASARENQVNASSTLAQLFQLVENYPARLNAISSTELRDFIIAQLNNND